MKTKYLMKSLPQPQLKHNSPSTTNGADQDFWHKCAAFQRSRFGRSTAGNDVVNFVGCLRGVKLVSGGCLKGVCRFWGVCLKGVWRMSGGFLEGVCLVGPGNKKGVLRVQ